MDQMREPNPDNRPKERDIVKDTLGQMALAKGEEAHRILKENAGKIDEEAMKSLKDGLALKIGKALLDYTQQNI